MFDLKATKLHVVFRITGRRRLVIYGMVILAAAIMFFSLVHEEHTERALQKTRSSDVNPTAPIAISTLH